MEERLKQKSAEFETQRKGIQASEQAKQDQRRQTQLQRVATQKDNLATAQLERSEKSRKYLEKALKSSKVLNEDASMRQSKHSDNDGQDKAKQVLEEGKKILDVRRSQLNQKMQAFSERMRKKEEEQALNREERREQARQWSETLHLNVGKKRRKESYRRELLEDKLKSVDQKQQMFASHKELVRKERFYAKVANEMKQHYIKESLHDMSLKKNWSLQRIQGIMSTFQPDIIQAAPADTHTLDRKINKVLTDPFYSLRISFILLSLRHPEQAEHDERAQQFKPWSRGQATAYRF